jgi:bifunctional non-homologous end joining protein LigD
MEQNITLYFRQGSSDKVYQASIESKGDGFIVAFAYGRRGATLSSGVKTQAPVDLDQAKRVFDKLVAEKTAKGYTPGVDGTPYQQTEKADRATGIHCQLLNPVEEEGLESLIADPAYWMQEKFDGRRLLLLKKGVTVTGINRLGLAIAIPNSLVQFAAECPVDFLVDGEAIGDTLYAVDALRIGSEEITGLRYSERYLRFTNLLASFRHECVHLVDTAYAPKQKRELFAQCKKRRAEGVVFKHTDAPYVAGRRASGGSQLKYKFCETASFIVGKVNSRRSVALLLFQGDKIRAAGNVTIPPNHEIPNTGNIVECRYLYAFRESGCIYQPIYLGAREDITAEECTTSQLKYKMGEAVEEAA